MASEHTKKAKEILLRFLVLSPDLFACEQRLAQEEKHSLHNQLTVQCLHRAIGDGNRYIARIITWCDASDIAQIAILQSTLEALSSHNNANIPPYRVCPTCGAISNARLFTDYCPLCMTAVGQFHTFE